jgi:hypothetical protein
MRHHIRLSFWNSGSGPGRWLTMMSALFMTASLGHVVPCRAGGLVIEAPIISAQPGTSGSFDVLLVNNGSTSYNVAGDSLGMVLSEPPGSLVQFTNATISTVSAAYIFTQSFDANFGLPLSTNSLPNTLLMTSDTGDPVSGYAGFTTVNPGDIFGLARVSYTISPGSVFGTSDLISFVLTNGATSLSDPNGGVIPFTVQDGSIGAPEPPTSTLGSIAAIIGFGASWRRRRGVLFRARTSV